MTIHRTDDALLAKMFPHMSEDCRRLNPHIGDSPVRSTPQHPLTPDVLIIDLAGTATAPPGVRRLTFPRMHLVSEANQREHWSVKHRRAKEQRYTVYYNLRCTYWSLPQLPCIITLTRIAPRALDTDNLVSSFKACQDGVADWLAGAEGQGQDRLEGLTWHYDQQPGKPREYGLLITIEECSHDLQPI